MATRRQTPQRAPKDGRTPAQRKADRAAARKVLRQHLTQPAVADQVPDPALQQLGRTRRALTRQKPTRPSE